jgi:hypothetical protein
VQNAEDNGATVAETAALQRLFLPNTLLKLDGSGRIRTLGVLR